MIVRIDELKSEIARLSNYIDILRKDNEETWIINMRLNDLELLQNELRELQRKDCKIHRKKEGL